MLLVLGASLLLAACGDDGTNPELLSEKTANSMLDDLEAANEAFEAGDCDKMDRRLQKVLDQINALGSPPIDKALKLNLREGTEALMEQSDECESAEAAPPEEEEPAPAPAPEPETPEEPSDSGGQEVPDETNPDQPEQPEPEPAPEPQPEPAPEPNPPPQPEPPAPTPPSGGIGPGSEAGN